MVLLWWARVQKLAGMTGTAKTEAQEFSQIYKLEVAVVPTNVPTKRVDHADVVFGKEAGVPLQELVCCLRNASRVPRRLDSKMSGNPRSQSGVSAGVGQLLRVWSRGGSVQHVVCRSVFGLLTAEALSFGTLLRRQVEGGGD